MKSIMQSKKECYLCRKDANEFGYIGDLTDKGLDKHHVIFGTANRKLSEKWGLWVYLCKKHHNEDHGLFAVHYNKKLREDLCKDAETAFLKAHSFDDWMSIFGKNYLDEDEINAIKTKAENTQNNESLDFNGDLESLLEKNGEKTKTPSGFFFLED